MFVGSLRIPVQRAIINHHVDLHRFDGGTSEAGFSLDTSLVAVGDPRPVQPGRSRESSLRGK